MRNITMDAFISARAALVGFMKKEKKNEALCEVFSPDPV